MRWQQQALTVVGVHAEGEYGKVVTEGIVDVPGTTMFDKMRHLRDHSDGLRKFLLFEPRGAAVHSANLVLPSSHPKAQMGYVIMESAEYPLMSGSNTICTATAILETGLLPISEPVTQVTLETPGGLIEVTCQCRSGKVRRVKFRNVPAFVERLDAPVEVAGFGTLQMDIAYGGTYIALVEAAAVGFRLVPDEARDICATGERIKRAVREQVKVVHPEIPEIRDISLIEFLGPVRRNRAGLTARNTVVVSPGRLDRSPCGTGTSARLAVMAARKKIEKGQPFDHESIIGSHFFGEIVGTTRVGDRHAVVSTVAGRGYLTSIGQYRCHPDDPFPEGYTLADTWLHAI